MNHSILWWIQTDFLMEKYQYLTKWWWQLILLIMQRSHQHDQVDNHFKGSLAFWLIALPIRLTPPLPLEKTPQTIKPPHTHTHTQSVCLYSASYHNTFSLSNQKYFNSRGHLYEVKVTKVMSNNDIWEFPCCETENILIYWIVATYYYPVLFETEKITVQSY